MLGWAQHLFWGADPVQGPRCEVSAGSLARSSCFGQGEVLGVLWSTSAGAGLGTGTGQLPKEAGAGARRGCRINGDDSVGKWDSSSFISLECESEAADGKGRQGRTGGHTWPAGLCLGELWCPSSVRVPGLRSPAPGHGWVGGSWAFTHGWERAAFPGSSQEA